MEPITVVKAELLKALTDNRADHRQILAQAMDGYREKAKAALDAELEDLAEGRNHSITIHISMPSDHTGDYDRAIAMVKMSIGDKMTLSEQDFSELVMDDWGWQERFLSNTYGSPTATSKFSARYRVT